MHLSLPTASLLPLALYASAAVCKTPELKRAFTAHVTLGNPIGPVPVAGGQTAVEPIIGGNITGPLFTGTIVSGSAVVTVTGKGKVANPSVQIFGEAEDGSPFIANGQGVGEVGAQVARIIVEIGGKYAKLADEFILATFTDNDKNPPTESTIEAWIVDRSD